MDTGGTGIAMKAITRMSVLVLILLLSTAGLCSRGNAFFVIGNDSQTTAKTAKEIQTEGCEYGAQGKFKKAKEEFEKALKVDPFSWNLKVLLRIIEDVIDQKIEAKTAMHYFRGLTYGLEDYLDEAIAERIDMGGLMLQLILR